jgi:dihydrofolate reductase
MTQISLIAALDRNRAIGFRNQLPWSLPDDLRRFKRLTMGHVLLMGRKTAESIGRPLPGRHNLVLTRSGVSPIAGMDPVVSLDSALDRIDGELFVIGGGEIYALALPRASRMFLTHVDTALEQADTWFPEHAAAEWHMTAREVRAQDAQHAHGFEYVGYIRKVPR